MNKRRLSVVPRCATFSSTSVDQIIAEAASLPEDQRKALISRLLELGRAERDAKFRKMLAQKIDDKDPSHWVPMEDLARHLRLGSETE